MTHPKPPRTLGISLAILASVMLFTILPLLQVAILLALRARLGEMSLALPNGGESGAPFAVGSEYEGIADASLWIQVVFGVVFLGIAALAWRGRPARIRFALVGAVILLTAFTIVTSAAPLMTSPDPSAGLDSGAALRDVLLSGRLIMSVLVAFYVVWYLNRAPARAFYRGYYLAAPEPAATPQP